MPEAPTSVKGPPALLASAADALPPGTRLAEFEIRRVLGAGGFGIVYLAWDHALEREVALKEYMPATLAGRGPGQRVTMRAMAHEETFALGLRSFVNEARMLARFDHASLVKVFRFWEDNGTAYMAMPMYHGRTLRQVRQQLAAGSPGEAWCRALIDPLLGALECLHREGVYHRDIAPDNIVLADSGQPVLLDFGAARRVIGDRTHLLTAILKPHFAPIEQYADVSAMRQGPWTDLYGLAATTYYLLTGQPPLAAAARALHDELMPLSRLLPADCSPGFLAAIDWALAVRPQERPQSVAIWRDVLDGRMPLPGNARHDLTLPAVSALAGAHRIDFDPTQPLLSSGAMARPAGSVPSTNALWRGFTVPGGVPVMQPAAAAVPEPVAPPAPRPPDGARRAWAGAAGAAAVLGLSAWAWLAPATAPAPVAPIAMAQPAAASAPAVAAKVAPPPAPTVVLIDAPPSAAPAGPTPPSQLARAEPPPAAAPPSAAAEHRQHHRAPPRRAQRRSATREVVAGPSERCADRFFLTRVFCEKHECDSDARLRNHPECVRMRRQEEERRRRQAQL